MTTTRFIGMLAIVGFFGACASNVQAPSPTLDKNQLKVLVGCVAKAEGGGHTAPIVADVSIDPGTSDISVVSTEDRPEGGGHTAPAPKDGSVSAGTSDSGSPKLSLVLSAPLNCGDSSYVITVSGVASGSKTVVVDTGNGATETVAVAADGTFECTFSAPEIPDKVDLTADSI
jgi:hypothetical protein